MEFYLIMKVPIRGETFVTKKIVQGLITNKNGIKKNFFRKSLF